MTFMGAGNMSQNYGSSSKKNKRKAEVQYNAESIRQTVFAPFHLYALVFLEKRF